VRNAIHLFAVIRVDADIKELEDAITVKEVLPTREEAVSEVHRLNQLNAAKGCHYFWQTTRYRKPLRADS